MAKSPCRRPDHRPVKVHRSYSVEEAALVLNVHRNTIRVWIRKGLPLIDRKKPFLIQGTALIAYVRSQNAANKRPCGPGQIYCLPCRATKAPDGDMADYVARTDRTGDLIGLCPNCSRLIYRRVSWSRLDVVRGGLEVRIMKGHPRIDDATCPSVISDIGRKEPRNAA